MPTSLMKLYDLQDHKEPRIVKQVGKKKTPKVPQPIVLNESNNIMLSILEVLGLFPP
jgi:hypothetical protein